MSNIFWYYCSSVMGAGMTFFTILNKKNIITIAARAFFAMSFIMVGEFFVLTIFGGYTYKPGVFTDPFADSVIGHILGNLLLWPGAASLVAAFSLGYRWMLLISVAFMLIETLFLNLGIYEHHWWRTYMTGIAVVFCLTIFKMWAPRWNDKQHTFLRNITFYFLSLLFIHLPTTLLLLFERQHFSIGWVENFYKDSILFAFIYHGGMSFVYVVFICILKKWPWQLTPILIFLLSDYILVSMNILFFQDGWNLPYLTLLRTISLVIVTLLEKYTCIATISQSQPLR